MHVPGRRTTIFLRIFVKIYDQVTVVSRVNRTRYRRLFEKQSRMHSVTHAPDDGVMRSWHVESVFFFYFINTFLLFYIFLFY